MRHNHRRTGARSRQTSGEVEANSRECPTLTANGLGPCRTTRCGSSPKLCSAGRYRTLPQRWHLEDSCHESCLWVRQSPLTTCQRGSLCGARAIMSFRPPRRVESFRHGHADVAGAAPTPGNAVATCYWLGMSELKV